MNHFWRKKGWRWVAGNQDAERKEALSSHIYFYFIWFEAFQERKSFFILQIFLFLFDQQPRDVLNSQKAEAVPGLALRARSL